MPVDFLTCRSPSRCRTCEHDLGARGCALEADVEAAVEAMAPAASRPRPIPVLLRVDARPVGATA